MVAAGISVPGSGGGTAAAQASAPCSLLTNAEIQPLAPKVSIAAGVSATSEAVGYGGCRYTWGEGVSRYKLDVTINDAARMSAYVHGTAYVKGRVLQVLLDGFDARDKKDQVIALLESAASRL